MSNERTARLAVDIGGTFTDIALQKADGTLVTAKTLTTPRAPEDGVISGVFEALARGAATPGDIGVIIHGTTLATNALIEKRGATTALLTTHGHRDSLEMAYENRFEQYDVMIDRPAPLVPRWLRLPVRERLSARGETLIALDEDSVRAIVPVLERENVESLAVGFLHSYANADHERRAGAIIAKALPGISISLSADVAPEIREYERQTTTVANAYVRPLMERYLRALETSFRDRGFDCPFLLVTSGGGLCTVETAARFPVRLVESGPAGGAVLAAAIAKKLGAAELLSFDMGGTTAKMCLINDYEPSGARVFEVDRSYRFKKGSGMPIRIPVIELVEIGAGGGSIAQVDALKRIEVGPASAGADPGPACYGRGGVSPTVTDANVVAGRIVPEAFAGGSISLNVGESINAMEREVGAPLGLDADGAAFGVSEMVDENMAAAARAHAVEQGSDISRRTMIAFGGAAPLHAARLAEKLGLDRVIVPEGAGVGSAIGFLLAPASYEIIRSLPMRLDAFDRGRIDNLMKELRAEAQDVVLAADKTATLAETKHAFMRYVGQGYEIAAPIADDIDADELRKSFERAYARLYGRNIPGMAIEILSWSLRICAATPAGDEIAPLRDIRPVKTSTCRDVFDAGSQKRISYDVFDRAALSAGDAIEGPALIVEAQTTTVVSARFNAAIDNARNIILTRKGAA
ncbi:MAG: hydantoinase/oxoprolinase family protein [Parvularculaceae bacterium]|nr:hydantoinase/oxoprolinase family protein [Parvularculaceae bacterium]